MTLMFQIALLVYLMNTRMLCYPNFQRHYLLEGMLTIECYVTFCNLMNDVLYEFLDSFIVVYLDDNVIYS